MSIKIIVSREQQTSDAYLPLIRIQKITPNYVIQIPITEQPDGTLHYSGPRNPALDISLMFLDP